MYIRSGLLCPSCVMSVTNYIRDGLFVRDELCFLVLQLLSYSVTQSLSHSLTHSLKPNPGLISGPVGRHPDCYAEEQYKQYTIFVSYVR